MRICIVPEYPTNLMSGGLQVQAESTRRALCDLEGKTRPFLFRWSDAEPPADLYHFMGFPPHVAALAGLVARTGKPYVITMLFGGDAGRIRLGMAWARHWLKTHLLRSRLRSEAIRKAGAVIVLTPADAEAARRIFGLPSQRVHVVHNGVNREFFCPSAATWENRFGTEPFVLCVGAIQARKGQLALVDACNQLSLPVVLLGPVLSGEAEYGTRVLNAMRVNEKLGGKWMEHLRNEDALLVSAYAACRLFALMSKEETQPLSVMQAMAARKPVLLLRSRYTHDELFRELPTVPSLHPETVKFAVERAWESGKPATLSDSYTWTAVARKLYSIYSNCVGR